MKSKSLEYYYKNKKKISKQKNDRYATDDSYKKKISNRSKKWQKENPIKACQNVLKWQRKNKDKYSTADLNYKLRKFGINQSEFKEMTLKQNGKCAICGDYPKNANAKHARLSIDHDHKTKKVRGLLCHRCNVGIGYFKNDPGILLAAISYLNKSNYV